jgi:hypothetical protein
MMILLARLMPYIAGVAAVLAILYMAYEHGVDTSDARWQTKWDAQASKQMKEKAEAEAIARVEEQRRQTAINEVINRAQDELNNARADALTADVAATSLREHIERLGKAANTSACDTSTTKRGASTSTPNALLADMLKRADQRAGELAKHADEARAAGLACVRAYNSLTNTGAEQWQF